MMTFGMLYWLLPRLFQTPLWSTRMATWHFWVGTIGILLYIVPIYAAGLTQGLMWREMDETGRLVYPDFIETVQTIIPHWRVRVAGGLLFFSGMILLGINFLMTWMGRPSVYHEPVYSAPKLGPYVESKVSPAVSALKDAPVLEVGKKLDVWARMDWHRRWERMPVKFTVLTLLAVVIASLFEMIPTFLIRSNVPTIASVKPYTPLELAGRDIYVAEGCYNCHSQMIRPIVAETKRFGEYSKPGESIYDRPFQWGSRRIGPDLAREGGKQSSFWHWLHFENPEQVSPGSVMPNYEHLLVNELDFKKTSDRVRAAHLLGAPYERELDEAPEMARNQAEEVAAEIVKQGGPVKRGETLVMNTQAVALIAYLQRLGVDLNRPAEPVTAAAPEETPAPAETPAAAETEGQEAAESAAAETAVEE
jgi:cytochrome c oxidase cbb3-type subunit I/II